MVRSVYRTSQTAYVQGTPSPVLQISGFTYDNVYQLTQTVLNGGTSETYTHDDVGNRTASLGVSPFGISREALNR